VQWPCDCTDSTHGSIHLTFLECTRLQGGHLGYIAGLPQSLQQRTTTCGRRARQGPSPQPGHGPEQCCHRCRLPVLHVAQLPHSKLLNCTRTAPAMRCALVCTSFEPSRSQSIINATSTQHFMCRFARRKDPSTVLSMRYHHAAQALAVPRRRPTLSFAPVCWMRCQRS